jgi:hypothetical protein
MDNQQDIGALIKERFALLPKVVQDAITSAEVTAHLRQLADGRKLHFDQWEKLEYEVQLTLLGINHSQDLENNIKAELGIGTDDAHALALDIGRIVFDPIREELERSLSAPDAKSKEVSAMEATRSQLIASERSSLPSVAPATPPAQRPLGEVKRSPPNTAYAAASQERKNVAGDPYLEQVK